MAEWLGARMSVRIPVMWSLGREYLERGELDDHALA
jgi:hypothetical protein